MLKSLGGRWMKMNEIVRVVVKGKKKKGVWKMVRTDCVCSISDQVAFGMSSRFS